MTIDAVLTPGTARIREINDLFRTTFIGGRVMITEGVRDRGQDFESACVEAVQTFRDFGEDNDPHHEHDFGKVMIEGTPVFWKIDYYDQTLTYGSENPADTGVTTRVMTIMLASEY